MKKLPSIFLIFLLYRLSSVFIIQTSYVPDEYWQSLEVAHNMAFGYGYLTWEWKQGLRSYLYPLFISIFYKFLHLIRFDFPFLIIFIPKVLQAFLTAVSDQYFLLLCKNFGFQEYWTKIAILTNWFWYYCGFRTITNSFETAFTIIGLYYYPWNLFVIKKEDKATVKMRHNIKDTSLKYLSIAAINCVVRPTAATIWAPLVLFQLFYTKKEHLKEFFMHCVFPASLISIPTSLIVDYLWYGKFCVPAYNFLTFNIFEGISSFYGTHPFYWYITEGLPVVLGLHFFPFSFGLILILRKLLRQHEPLKKVYSIWLFILISNIVLLSKVPHKEFRFILPLTPLMMLIVVKVSSEFFNSSRGCKLSWTLLSMIGFIIPCLLLGIFHQRGTLDLMSHLRNSVKNCKPNCFFLFLMPCHSTPLYSHLHVNVSTRFLTCEPPINNNHYDESEDFFNNPQKWLSINWNDKETPSHIALFDSLEDKIGHFLSDKGYRKAKKFLHTIFAQNNSGRYIFLYESSDDLL